MSEAAQRSGVKDAFEINAGEITARVDGTTEEVAAVDANAGGGNAEGGNAEGGNVEGGNAEGDGEPQGDNPGLFGGD